MGDPTDQINPIPEGGIRNEDEAATLGRVKASGRFLEVEPSMSINAVSKVRLVRITVER